MPDFAYLAIDPAGKERKGRLRADTVEDAKAKLDARKLFVVRVEEGQCKTARPGRALFSGGAKTLSA